MRRIREAVLPITWNNDDLPKTVREYREKYKGVSRILDDHPEILILQHHFHGTTFGCLANHVLRCDVAA